METEAFSLDYSEPHCMCSIYKENDICNKSHKNEMPSKM